MGARIAVIIGSESDQDQIEKGLAILKELKISYETVIISCHRHGDRLRQYLAEIKDSAQVVIAGAGMAAALPGIVASELRTIPVIGVAFPSEVLDGLDALFSIARMPKGIALTNTGIGKAGFNNACLSAASILTLNDPKLKQRLVAWYEKNASTPKIPWQSFDPEKEGE